ncbi:unnamed protein product [Closterium sp. Naga37s-1]|nr:unnamed protein product [Closterium sp. Naga37s-1]
MQGFFLKLLDIGTDVCGVEGPAVGGRASEAARVWQAGSSWIPQHTFCHFKAARASVEKVPSGGSRSVRCCSSWALHVL